MSDHDERTYLISGEDQHGDQHMVMTTSLERAMVHYQDMVGRLGDVQGNEAFEGIARPLIKAAALPGLNQPTKE